MDINEVECSVSKGRAAERSGVEWSEVLWSGDVICSEGKWREVW